MREEWSQHAIALGRHGGLVAGVAAAKASLPIFYVFEHWWPMHPGQFAVDALAIWAGDCVVVAALWSFVLVGHRVGTHLRMPLWAQGSITAIVAGLVGAALFRMLVASHAIAWKPLPWFDWHFLAHLWSWHILLAAMLVLAHGFAERSRALDGEMHDAELELIAQQRNQAEVQLQLLQAQIEPHFVFNALANVRRLLRTDPTVADRMLADLLRYLQEALPRLRDEHSTLGREAELVRAFLAVHQVRMGARLLAEVDIPDALAACAVPPMLLLTLVENALKHGLQPLVEGGAIRVAAKSQDGRLTLTVADTGRGMGTGLGAGTGLANTRARLRALYGVAADLSLRVNQPRGVLATISMPQAVV